MILPIQANGPLHGLFPQNQASTSTSRGITYNYYEFGNPDGRPLILVHGFPDGPVAWEAVLAHLDLTKLRVIVPYLRGCGRSSVEREELLSGQSAALGQDVLALADELKLSTFDLAGHDWGARACYVACLIAPHRVRSLTALASSYVSWGGGLLPPAQVHGYWYQFYFQLPVAETMLTEHRADFCKELWRVWSPTYQFSDQTFDEAASAWNNPQFVPIVLNYYRMRWRNAISKPAYSSLQEKVDAKPAPTIQVTTIFVQGEADACDLWHGGDGQERYFAAYERVVLEGVGHFPHRENPDAVAAVIKRQLNRTEKHSV